MIYVASLVHPAPIIWKWPSCRGKALQPFPTTGNVVWLNDYAHRCRDGGVGDLDATGR